MKYLFYVMLPALALTWAPAGAQIDSLIVETYYVSDDRDASDTIGGGLPEGSVTYRIFIDLSEGTRLIRIFGDRNHPLRFSASMPFFNHADRGELFGYDIRDNRLNENTVALDTWITIGLATDEHLGIPKADDPDGSFIGGEHNDGGSADISGGLLVNDDPRAGLPLTTSDGLVPQQTDANWYNAGFADTSVFGQAGRTGYQSCNAVLHYRDGISGPAPENRILIAQLTTTGTVSFELNLELKTADNQTVRYVASDDTLLADERYSRWLSFPFASGCTNPDYLEYDRAAIRKDGSCKTLIILGCMDPAACNYDPRANFPVQELCCYGPDSCDGRNIKRVCPHYLNAGAVAGIHLFPNPVAEFLQYHVTCNRTVEAVITVHNSFGETVAKGTPAVIGHDHSGRLDVSGLQPGIYLFRISAAGQSHSKMFIKN